MKIYLKLYVEISDTKLCILNTSLKFYSDGVALSEKAAKAEKLRKAKKLKLGINNPNDKIKIDKIQTKPYYFGIKNVAKHAKEIGITYRCSVRRK